jgi:hypothetical protein
VPHQLLARLQRNGFNLVYILRQGIDLAVNNFHADDVFNALNFSNLTEALTRSTVPSAFGFRCIRDLAMAASAASD